MSKLTGKEITDRLREILPEGYKAQRLWGGVGQFRIRRGLVMTDFKVRKDRIIVTDMGFRLMFVLSLLFAFPAAIVVLAMKGKWTAQDEMVRRLLRDAFPNHRVT